MMWRFATLLAAGLAASGVAGNTWFPGTKAVYNKWHETELERWLADHDIPYPSPADRKDLESLVEKNWNDRVVEPYKSWDTAQLKSFLHSKGHEARKEADETKESLLSKVKANWVETEENAYQAFGSVKEWILDTWTDSQLKAFCDKNNIPGASKSAPFSLNIILSPLLSVPQPRHRDTVLQKARSGYDTAAKKLGEYASYPGSWLYATWSESDLKSWLDTHGFPAPQPSTRDKLIASVRRNSRLAYLRDQKQAASASASAQAAYATLTDMIIDAWGKSQLKEFCDKNAIPVPQGTKANKIRALVRKYRAQILGDTVNASGASMFGAATSNARNQYAKVTESASLAAQDAFNQAIGLWSESRLKAYLDARGVPVPQKSNLDELRALARKHGHKAFSGYKAWVLDDFSRENLENFLSERGNAAAKSVAKKKDTSRDELVSAANSAYSSASKAGGATYAAASSYLASATADVRKNAFDTWSESDLKAYLDSYGVPVPQGLKIEELKALARRQSTYFAYGTSSPSETLFAKLGESVREVWNWVANQLNLGSQAAQEKVAEAEAAAKAKTSETKQEL